MPSRNYVYAIVSTSPSPTGRGALSDWLEYYKLNVEGETHVDCDGTAEMPEEGDTLWFQVDDRIVACVRIKLVMLDPLRDVFEFWYEGSEVVRINGIHTEDRGTRWIETDTSNNWNDYVNKTRSIGGRRSTGSE